jgi:hypothetical protein
MRQLKRTARADSGVPTFGACLAQEFGDPHDWSYP